MTSSSYTELDLSKFQPTEPSIVLPYVYTDVPDEKIQALVGSELELGEIASISRIEKENYKTGRKFNVVFIHFKTWHSTDLASKVRQQLLNDQEARIYHDQYDHYWKARAYVPKEKPNEKPKEPLDEPNKPRIEFD